MRYEGNRVILFAEVNREKENILSLIEIDHRQERQIMALSDEQISEIDDHLLVRSMDELWEKFSFDFSYIDFEEQEVTQANEKVQHFYQVLTDTKQQDYQVWYYASENGMTKQEVHRKTEEFTRQYELWLGIKAFFEQAEGCNAELVIANISDMENMECDAFDKLKLYVDTVNDKLDQTKRIAYAILPQVPMVLEKDVEIRERFAGNKRQREKHEMFYAVVARILELMESRDIVCCYQYETGYDASARALAAEGRDRLKREAEYFEKMVNSQKITCCYPNLTWIENRVYIGAAYVVAGMLIAGCDEGSQSYMPRELYPLQNQIYEEITQKPFGSMLVHAKQEGSPHMHLWWARTQKWHRGAYEKVVKGEEDV